MTIIKDGDGVLIILRVMLMRFSSTSYKRAFKDGAILKGDTYYKLGADINTFDKYLKRC